MTETNISLDLLAPSLNLLFRKRSNPQAPFYDALHRFESVLGAGVDQTKQVLDNAGGRTVALKVDEKTASATRDLGWLLRIIREIMNV